MSKRTKTQQAADTNRKDYKKGDILYAISNVPEQRSQEDNYPGILLEDPYIHDDLIDLRADMFDTYNSRILTKEPIELWVRRY
jgi:hypothetical protein